ncbi:MAG TPA: MarR family transcriptional regulator [Acidimicrobiia bacterium]|jgi:DNA-binding MarR family transcriptional regulator
MSGERDRDTALPALLRAAWTTYGNAVRAAMVEAGFDDLPRNGAYVVGAIAGKGLPLSRIVGQLGVSKQAAGQLVDTLVARGYLDRVVDPEDRRRLSISLTPRGAAAATVAKDSIARVDRGLVKRVGRADVAAARRTLAALIEAHASVDGP